MLNKYSWPLLLGLIGCGSPLPPEEQLSDSGRINREIELKAVDNVSLKETEWLRNVCYDLQIKNQIFSTTVINNPNKFFRYDMESKKCAETKSHKYSVSLYLKKVGTLTNFYLGSGVGEFFNQYETDYAGMIAPFCQKLYSSAGAFSRVELNGAMASWIYVVDKNSVYCLDQPKTNCVVIEIGMRKPNGKYQVKDLHAMNISNDASLEYRGEITGRKHINADFCAEGTNELMSTLVPY